MSRKSKLNTITYQEKPKRKNEDDTAPILDTKTLHRRLRWQTLLIVIGLALFVDIFFAGAAWTGLTAFVLVVGLIYSPIEWALYCIGVPLAVYLIASVSAYMVTIYARSTDRYIYQLAITVSLTVGTLVGGYYLFFAI